MAYLENEKKFVVVLNRRHPMPRVLNAIGHTMAGLVSALPYSSAEFIDYPNAADGFDALISRFPCIILESKNSSQLSTLQRAAREAGVQCNVFVSAMIGASADEQVAATRDASSSDLDYVVVVLFGESEKLDPLTKKFSLFKESFVAA